MAPQLACFARRHPEPAAAGEGSPGPAFLVPAPRPEIDGGMGKQQHEPSPRPSKQAARAATDEILSKVKAIADTPDQCRERIEEYRQAGCGPKTPREQQAGIAFRSPYAGREGLGCEGAQTADNPTVPFEFPLFDVAA
jgi:alkanesulfonate monooxygenase SsuD/methylene tetrahydromethanopterin reductase-like flavin-dependent oxidoreductase (luciferase family)